MVAHTVDERYSKVRFLALPDSYCLEKGCTVAPRTIPSIRWHIQFGDTLCPECGWEPQHMTVVLNKDTKTVIIDHHFGCYGGTRKDDETIGEALEWLRMERRWWEEDGKWFDTVIQELEKHQEQ